MKFSVIKQQRIWWTVSLLITLAGFAAMIVSYTQFQAPLRPGLDFIGGTRLQLELDCSVPQNCDRPIDSAKVREILTQQDLGDSSIQVIENYGLSIRSKTLDVNQRTQLEKSLSESIGKFDPQKTQIDTVGPTIGRELFVAGMLALILSFFGIIVYLSFRFQFDYAFFAIVALFHDVLITAGIFSILGVIAGIEVDSLFLVALLTIIGFSVNDTVVIYDRIRENLVKTPD
ncbi:MAG: protein translocase subunit SecF, partial [Hydrococcus sp. Prado102]|nr:protein translocase subunit SecF [Hydrococcus sp. Prado102]